MTYSCFLDTASIKLLHLWHFTCHFVACLVSLWACICPTYWTQQN